VLQTDSAAAWFLAEMQLMTEVWEVIRTS